MFTLVRQILTQHYLYSFLVVYIYIEEEQVSTVAKVTIVYPVFVAQTNRITLRNVFKNKEYKEDEDREDEADKR